MSLNLGLWSSIHSSKVDGSTSGAKNWYEFDYTVGIATTFEKNFTLTVSYFEFNYPAISAGPGDPQRSINVSLAYDDTDLLGMWALHPHVTFLQEVTGDTTGGHVGLGSTETNGQYYEVGIAPSFTFLKDSKYPVTFTAPVNAGFGSSGFYAGNGFGYLSAGGVFSVPLAFIPAGYGTWTASVGGTYYYLGKTTARVVQNTEFSTNNVNGGQPHNRGVVTGTIGLTF